MTNREWVNSMDNKTFSEWCCFGETVADRTRVIDERMPDGTVRKTVLHVADEPTPKLITVKQRYNSSFKGLLVWLDEERVEE